MSNLKPLISACLALTLAAPLLLSLSCSGAAAYRPSGLPQRIAFVSDREKTAHIYTMSPDGTDIQATSNDNRTSDGFPAWSPDGTKIAFGSNQSGNYEIWTMNADGSNRVKLTDRPGPDSLPRWSPDGSQIAFTGEVPNANGITDFEIFVVKSDGSGLTQLTDDPGSGEGAGTGAGQAVKARWNSVPAWSPDGTKIIFGSNRDGNSISPVLYSMNADGSDQRKLGLFTDVDGSQPDWSPATGKIVYVRGSRAKVDIWAIDAWSPFPLLTARKLTDNIDSNANPVWSPDGKQIAYVSDANGKKDIYVMDADGSNVRRLTFETANDGYPAWRP